MTPVIVARMQRQTRDRYMNRLELPDRRRNVASIMIFVLCGAGVLASLFIGYALGMAVAP